VDVSFFTQEVFDLSGEQEESPEHVFEAIGFHVAQVRDASPLRAFRFRFPWLLATIGSGTLCALLAGRFEVTLARSLVLTFFLTMVLGLGESVSIQSMTVAIQALRATRPTLRWYMRALRREAGTAVLLGVACGTVVGTIVWLWRGAALAGVSIGGSLLLALCAACLFGLSIPAGLHALKLDPKIAAGPVTLAFTDVFTLLFYFGAAAWLL
jgi:magnesium transporter